MLQRPRGLVTHNAMKKRPKYVVSNIRFKVARDEHGVYNGDTDAAAKAFGADLRLFNCIFEMYMPGVIVPMMCIVDFPVFAFSALLWCLLRWPKWTKWVRFDQNLNADHGLEGQGGAYFQ